MTANLENCKRLYELSGWNDEDLLHWQKRVGGDGATMYDLMSSESGFCPAYDSGYLLRKLQREGTSLFLEYGDWDYPSTIQSWRAIWNGSDSQKADTPEDALCLLAIKLFEEGILTQ